MTTSVRPHNAKAALTWGSGGAAYDRVSQTIADALEHTVERVAPHKGEACLDVATGTGWTARRLHARGAAVTGVDIGAGVIAAAREFAPDIMFRVGDAECLDFPDQSFDVVVSTFGVMFVSRPEDAARELARVCRTGGRIGLATWLPGDTIEGLFKVMKPYMPAPPAPMPSPFDWGREARLQDLLGGAFDLRFEYGVTTLRMTSGAAAWDLFVTGYGPTKTIAQGLDEERLAALKREFIAFHDKYSTDLGIAMPRRYIVTVGVRT